jgi:membrane-bound serine protease (ClpP class)
MRKRNPRRSRVLGLAGSVLLALGITANGADAASSSPEILRLRLTGVVDPFVADYLRNGIGDAADTGKAAVLIEIDTPGGLDSSMREITQAILNAGLPVVCYVGPQGARAASAGAFVLMSCPIAAMAPGTNVGAATPVGLDGAVGSDKAVNDAAAYMRGLAAQRGRNEDLAVSFVTSAASISADQALSRGVIDLVASDESRLLQDVDGRVVVLADGSEVTLRTAGGAIEDRDIGAFIGFLHQLLDPNLAFIFFWLGLILIVLELLVPGHVFSGTVGTVLLILSIVSFGVLPVTLVGVALLVASAVAFGLEIGQPGLGIWSALGVITLVLGGWFLYDRAGGGGVSPLVIAPVALFVALFFGFVVTKVRSLWDLPPSAGPEAIVGRVGVALGAGLDPRGVVRVAAEEWNAVSEAGPIPGGAPVRVSRIEGLVLTVEPVVEHAPTDPVPPAPARGGGNR